MWKFVVSHALSTDLSTMLVLVCRDDEGGGLPGQCRYASHVRCWFLQFRPMHLLSYSLPHPTHSPEKSLHFLNETRPAGSAQKRYQQCNAPTAIQYNSERPLPGWCQTASKTARRTLASCYHPLVSMQQSQDAFSFLGLKLCYLYDCTSKWLIIWSGNRSRKCSMEEQFQTDMDPTESSVQSMYLPATPCQYYLTDQWKEFLNYYQWDHLNLFVHTFSSQDS